MRPFHALIAAAAAALVLAAPSSPSPGRGCQELQPKARLACAARAVHDGRTGLAWLDAHRSRLLGPSRYLLDVPVRHGWKPGRYRQAVRDHRWLVAYGLREQRLARALLNPWPAHHALWMCIHGDPAYGSHYGNEASTWDNHDTGHTGHYGGLQAHRDWYSLRGTADAYSHLEQERAAELAYRQSGYSPSWLIGQWGQTISPCWRYA